MPLGLAVVAAPATIIRSVTLRAVRSTSSSHTSRGTPTKVHEDVDAYLDDSERWPDEIAAIRPILSSCGLDETIKWGEPCYCVDDENVVLLQEFADHLALMFFRGALLDDPDDVLHDQGPNTHGPKRMEFTSVNDVESLSETIESYVREAIDHARAGTELPPRPQEELAPVLRERLAADDELAAAFERLTPGRRREYNLHVSGAKKAETRDRRIDAFVSPTSSTGGVCATGRPPGSPWSRARASATASSTWSMPTAPIRPRRTRRGASTTNASKSAPTSWST
ncbi:YdeI/OmpD-associated family protein [Ilumatobacter sp.]|uniref:YdeI/OmpD-associated family protein n=1 Tax=Ilumatobacter sp. TaxID=1967498 RepID=UPI003B525A53